MIIIDVSRVIPNVKISSQRELNRNCNHQFINTKMTLQDRPIKKCIVCDEVMFLDVEVNNRKRQ